MVGRSSELFYNVKNVRELLSQIVINRNESLYSLKSVLYNIDTNQNK
jgi:hypothetical protein